MPVPAQCCHTEHRQAVPRNVTGRQFFRTTDDGVELRVRLTPKSSRDDIGTVSETADGTAVQAYVRALPANGAANTALIALFAKRLRVPKSSVQLLSGSKSRLKVLALKGETQELRSRVEKLLDQKT